MFDLAEIGMMLIAGGSVVAAACATAMWRTEKANADYWYGAYSLLADAPAAPHVMCGACGVSVPLESDGFTVSEHNCAMGDLFSRDDLRS